MYQGKVYSFILISALQITTILAAYNNTHFLCFHVWAWAKALLNPLSEAHKAATKVSAKLSY